jgi:hypothetical protein
MIAVSGLMAAQSHLGALAQPGKQAASVPATPGGWPDPALLDALQQKKVPWNYRESQVSPYRLPDLLQTADSSRISSKDQWERKGRPETLDLFREYVYGRAPERVATRFELITQDERAMGGRAKLKRVRIICEDAGKSFSFEASLLTPTASKGRSPAFLLINHRAPSSADPTRKARDGFWPAEEIIDRGFAAAVFQATEVDPDDRDNTPGTNGVRDVFPGPGNAGKDAWGTLAAWAWGAGRVMDYLQTDPDVDATKVAVVGHSRGGKTSLWAGAEDKRFALVISNDSGCGGAALSRRIFGETVGVINRAFPHWFCDNFKAYSDREGELPVDQHQLLALIAPRGLYVASAEADFWADQRGEFLSLAHASPAYALFGHAGFGENEMPALDSPTLRDRTAYHIRRGSHNLTPYDWKCFMDFADKLWRDGKQATPKAP